MGGQKNIHLDLIQRCRENDPEAQKEVYHQYAGAMYNICVRMLGNRHDAEDALQESFIRVFRRIDTYNSKATLGAWIKRIVINCCVNHLKRKKFQWQELNGTETKVYPESIPDKINPRVIHEAIKTLPSGCRAVFTLKLLEGYDHKEISNILDISVSTSKSQLSRAKELLRTSLLKTVEL